MTDGRTSLADGNMTDLFLGSLSELVTRGVPRRIAHCAKMCLVDYLGCYAAGRKVVGERLRWLASGVGRTVPTDALAYGIAAHVAELDDGHRYGMLHLGAPVISALLAAAERHTMSADDFTRGVVLGYEATIRLARAVQPSCKLKGYHATGVCGTVGAALAIAYALRFDAVQVKSAFSAAATSAAGLLEMIEGDTELKPYNAGRAAMDGLVAAFAGMARFVPPCDALGGRRGFLALMTDEVRTEHLSGMEDDTYGIETIYRKPYAACRHCHAPIEAALNIATNPDFEAAQVKRIVVETYRLAISGHDHALVSSVHSAKMSIPYSVAAALIRRSGGMDAFSESAIADDALRALAGKVSIHESAEFTAQCPAKRIASVQIEMVDGKSFSSQVDYPKGEPENPMTDDELERKLRALTAWGGVGEDAVDALWSEVSKADFDVRHIISILNMPAEP